LTPDRRQSSLLWSVAVLFAVNILNFYDRHVPAALVEPLRREFHLTDTQNGLLGSAFIWIYALVGLPIGWLADSWSRRKLLAWGVFVWASLTAFAGLATNFAMLLISRLGVGVGEATCAPTGTSWLGDLFPASRRSRVFALFMLGVPVGGALGYFFTGPFAQAYGWRAAMILAAAPALLLIPALLLLREPERGASEPPRPVEGPSAGRGSILRVLRIPTFWWIIFSGALLNFTAYVVATFLPAFFSRVHGLSLASANVATGLAYLLGGVVGGLLAGYFGDSVIHRRANGRMLLPAAIALCAAPVAYLAILRPAGSIFAAGALFALTYAAINSYYGFVYSAIQDIIAPNLRGTAMAVYFLGMYLLGGSYGPVLTGKLSDIFARRAAALSSSAAITEAHRALGLQHALLVIPVGCILLASVLYMGSRTIVADMARRDAQS
jgi:MFS family permease